MVGSGQRREREMRGMAIVTMLIDRMEWNPAQYKPKKGMRAKEER
jgi:hypothetical protein